MPDHTQKLNPILAHTSPELFNPVAESEPLVSMRAQMPFLKLKPYLTQLKRKFFQHLSSKIVNSREESLTAPTLPFSPPMICCENYQYSSPGVHSQRYYFPTFKATGVTLK